MHKDHTRCVLRTEFRIVSKSNGRTVRGSITSTEIPSAASFSAASNADAAPTRERPDHGHIRTSAFYIRLAKRQCVFRIWHLPLHKVEQFMLDKHDRVVVTNRGFQQALGIVRRGRHHHFQPWHMPQTTRRGIARMLRTIARVRHPVACEWPSAPGLARRSYSASWLPG